MGVTPREVPASVGTEVTDVTEAAGTAIEAAGTADGAGRLAAVGVVDLIPPPYSVGSIKMETA